jgi:hypothetical protein
VGVARGSETVEDYRSTRAVILFIEAHPIETKRVRVPHGNEPCCAPTRAGAVTAAIGSTLLRSHGIIKPVQ